MAVYVTKEHVTFREVREEPDRWEKVYQATHSRNFRDYTELKLDTPFKISAGERKGLYVHSQLDSDEGVVYGARFQTGFCTRGCYWISRMFASSEHACD
jgi:hypothetical protein